MDKMEVYATVHQSVYVNPLDVVHQLFRKKTKGKGYFDVRVDTNGAEYFYEYEEYKYIKKIEIIDEETYSYLTGLGVVIEQLERERLAK